MILFSFVSISLHIGHSNDTIMGDFLGKVFSLMVDVVCICSILPCLSPSYLSPLITNEV